MGKIFTCSQKTQKPNIFKIVFFNITWKLIENHTYTWQNSMSCLATSSFNTQLEQRRPYFIIGKVVLSQEEKHAAPSYQPCKPTSRHLKAGVRFVDEDFQVLNSYQRIRNHQREIKLFYGAHNNQDFQISHPLDTTKKKLNICSCFYIELMKQKYLS